MKIKLFSLFFILCLSTALLTGCWDHRELNEISLVIAMGLDKDKGKNQYRISYQIVNPEEISKKTGGGGRTTPVTVYTSSGSTIFEAMRNAAEVTPRQLTISHIDIVIIGEELAKSGVHGILDYFERTNEGRLTPNVLVTRNTKAEKVLKTLTPIEKIPGFAIKGKLQTIDRKLSKGYSVTMDKVIREAIRTGGGSAITAIQLSGTDKIGSKNLNVQRTVPSLTIKISGLGMFKEGRLVGWLENDVARGAAVINNKLGGTAINVGCKNGKKAISVRVDISKTKMKASVRSHTPNIQIFVRQEGSIAEVDCPIDLTKPEEIKKLEKQWAQKIAEEIKNAVSKAQRERDDIFGFGEAVERANKQEWKKFESDWDSIFPICKVKVHVETKIRRAGLRSNPYVYSEKR